MQGDFCGVNFILFVILMYCFYIRVYAQLLINIRDDYEYFFSPLDGMLVHRRVTPSIKFAGTH